MNLIVNSIDAMKDVEGRASSPSSRSERKTSSSWCPSAIPAWGCPRSRRTRSSMPSSPRSSHGTGMGLSISRSIVESHNGRLWAADNSPRGARFHVILPTAVDAYE